MSHCKTCHFRRAEFITLDGEFRRAAGTAVRWPTVKNLLEVDRARARRDRARDTMQEHAATCEKSEAAL